MLKGIIALFFPASAALFLLASLAQADTDLAKEMTQRITVSKAQLEKSQRAIAEESGIYANKMSAMENQIAQLREKAAVVHRMAEEKALGLEQLKDRVEKWQVQSNYQKHLLTNYVEAAELSTEAFPRNDGQPLIDASALTLAVDKVNLVLSPQWESQEIVMQSGQIEKVETLHIGPVKVAFDAASQVGGPVMTEANKKPRVLNVFSQMDTRELGAIQQTGMGYLAFDPSLGNAYRLMQGEGNILSHLEKGGIWALPILFFGFLSLLIALIKGVELIRLPKVDTALAESIAGLDKQAVLAKLMTLRGAQKRLVEILLKNPVSDQRDDLLVASLMEHKHKLERFMGVVATSAAIAPLLGLLGTVSGMISTFKMMTIFGAGDASTVSGGISEALVTTELGLVVAIPSLIVSALMTRKTRSYHQSLESVAVRLSKVEV